MTPSPVHLRACLQMVAAEVTRRTLARICAIIRITVALKSSTSLLV
jgi:methylglyoxal synthase